MLDGQRSEIKQMYSRSLVGGRDLQDTIGVNFECNFDLRKAARGRRNIGEFELAEQVVVLCQRTFTLEELDKYGRLVVSGR